MNAAQLTQSLKSTAAELGFAVTGACPAVTPRGYHHFLEWLEAGYAGEMTYLPRRQEAYLRPARILENAKSILMLAMHYGKPQMAGNRPGYGRVARYAQGALDYHLLIRDRLDQLGSALEAVRPNTAWRGVVDTAPLLEREFAQLAGIGWQAKNTMLIDPRRGSWFFLAALLVDCELDYDEPFAADHCGTCRACLDACPTEAFVAPHVLDARRCISYLTIEHRGPIPHALRPLLGDWVFGCDVCQEVCPWNRFAEPTAEPAFDVQRELNPLELCELFALSEEAFRLRFKRTPLWRAKRRGILRNAAMALGNQRCREAAPTLIGGLTDAEPLVRGACAWALGKIALPEAAAALSRRRTQEHDEQVIEEIDLALHALDLADATVKTLPN